MRDYARIARALRAKAADPVVPPAERAALLEKATELETKYRNANSRFTDDTTTTSRDGFPAYGSPEWTIWAESFNAERRRHAQKIAEDLARNQWRWNNGGFDDDYMEDTYKYEPEDEDAGYDEWN